MTAVVGEDGVEGSVHERLGRDLDEAAALVEDGADAASADALPARELTVEDLVQLVETLTNERDEQLAARQRQQAEFENFRRRVSTQQLEQFERANESLVAKLLPALDAFDAALKHGVEGIEALNTLFLGILQKEGLEVMAPLDEGFDPNQHEAVMREQTDGEPDTVSDVLRNGYTWKGRVIRPAMVKVRA